MQDRHKTALLLGVVFVVLLASAIWFARLRVDFYAPITTTHGADEERVDVPAKQNLLSGFLWQAKEASKIPDGEDRLLIFRRGNTLVWRTLTDSTLHTFSVLPPVVMSRLSDFHLRTLQDKVIVQGEFSPGERSLAVAIPVEGTGQDTTFIEHPCLFEDTDGFLFRKRVCSTKGDVGFMVDERPLAKDHTFLFSSIDGVQATLSDAAEIAGEIGEARGRLPLAVQTTEHQAYIASYGEHGGFYGLSQIDLLSHKQRFFDLGTRLLAPFADIQIAEEAPVAALLRNHRSEYAFSDSYCALSEDGSKVFSFNTRTGEQYLLETSTDFIDTIHLSPNGNYLAMERYAKHPLCRLGERAQKQTEIVPLAGGERRQIEGDVVEWLTGDVLLTKDRSSGTYTLHMVSSDKAETMDAQGGVSFVGVLYRN